MAFSNEIKTKAFLMTKEGKSATQIADELNVSEKQINVWISNLNDDTKKCYDPTLYNEIIFERALNNTDIIDKDYINEIADLVFQGFLFIEIAAIYDVAEEDISHEINILNKVNSPFYDPAFFNRIIKQKEKNEAIPEHILFQKLRNLKKQQGNLKKLSNSKLVSIFEKKFTICQMVQEYLDSKMELSDELLAKKYSILPKTVREYLNGNDKENLVIKMFGTATFDKILAHRRARLAEARNLYSSGKDNSSTKNITLEETEISKKQLNLEEIQALEKIKKNISFWMHMIFKFRLSLEELARLVNIQNLSDLEYYLYSNWDVRSLQYVFLYQTNSQGENLKKAISFLNELKRLSKDSSEYKELVYDLFDKKYTDLLKKRKKNNRYVLEDEDIRTIILYKIKYVLPRSALPFKNSSLEQKCPQDLKDAFESINNYYEDVDERTYWKDHVGKRSYR